MHTAATGWSIRSPTGCSCRQGNRLASELCCGNAELILTSSPHHEIIPHSFSVLSSQKPNQLSFLTSYALAKLAYLVFFMIFHFHSLFLSLFLSYLHQNPIHS